MGSSSASAVAVSPADRFTWFSEMLSSELMPVALSTEHTADFRAEITNLGLGPVRLLTFAFSPVRSRRTPVHVRRGDPEQYQLALVTKGTFRVSLPRHESLIAGDMVLTDSSRPMEISGTSDDGQVRAAVLQIHRAALPLRSDRVDRLLAQPIPVSGGTGAILANFLGALVNHGPDCEAEETIRMGSIALDLATTCLAQRLGALDEAPAEARAQAMRQRITSFIEHNLGDPELTPRAIADRHNMSLRGLYALFEGQPISIAASIRRRRLERCHADLVRAELRSQPIQAIAARHGFTNAAAFSRAFREAYGITPTEHRATTLPQPPPAGGVLTAVP